MPARNVQSQAVWIIVGVLTIMVMAIFINQIFGVSQWSKDLIGSGFGGAGETLSAVGRSILE